MTEQKTAGGPDRDDGEARGVSGLGPRPPGEGWQRMWGESAHRPAPSLDVEMWRSDWREIRTLSRDSLPEGGCIVGIWWRPLKFTQGYGQAQARDLPSWATRPMIDSGPVGSVVFGPANQGHYALTDPPQWVGPGASLSQDPNIPDGARVVIGATAKPPKARIVRAWHDGDGYLFVLGSDGRILSRENNTWQEIATYPPGLEP